MESLELDGFRGFEQFRVEVLRRINLLVGTNNSGKTSILEAIRLLRSEGDPNAIASMMDRRGERFYFYPDEVVHRRPSESEFDIGHLFFGHHLEEGTSFKISSKGNARDQWITYQIRSGIEESSGTGSPLAEHEEEIGSYIAPQSILEHPYMGFSTAFLEEKGARFGTL